MKSLPVCACASLARRFPRRVHSRGMGDVPLAIGSARTSVTLTPKSSVMAMRVEHRLGVDVPDLGRDRVGHALVFLSDRCQVQCLPGSATVLRHGVPDLVVRPQR